MLWLIIAFFVIGGVAIAFDVSFWVAILIICGIIAAVCIIYMLKLTMKNDSMKKLISIIVIISLILLSVFVFTRCWGDTNDDEIGDEWSACRKCKGSGKVKNSLGYYVDCSRCSGVGYLPH